MGSVTSLLSQGFLKRKLIAFLKIPAFLKEKAFSYFLCLAMAQHPILSLVSKIDMVQKDFMEMEHMLSMLLIVISVMKSKQLGKRADLAKDKIPNENIPALLQSTHYVDNLLLKIGNSLDRCVNHSAYIQRLLWLRRCPIEEV